MITFNRAIYLNVEPLVLFLIAEPAGIVGPGQGALNVITFPLIPPTAQAPLDAKSLKLAEVSLL